MQRVNQYNFYQLGFVVHALSQISEGAKLKDIYFSIYNSERWLDFLLKDTLVPLGVSRPACIALSKAVRNIIAKTQSSKEGEAPDMEKGLEWGEAYQVTNALQTFETVFSAELQSLDTYFVSQRLGYVTHDLIEKAEKLLPEQIRSEIPEEAKEDLSQAGKCIAFEVPTSAGFHILRVTESVLRKYYEVVVGKKPRLKMRNWGAYIKHLEEAGADKKITSFLDHIRESYRNPILHPEVTLSPLEAQALLGACISAIIQMTVEIQRLDAEKTLLAVTNPK